MTDWATIKAAICDGRGFKKTTDGACVLADTMMPSGAAIQVHIQVRHGLLYLHDDGAAFDELARSAREVVSLAGVRTMLSKTNFRLADEGVIWCERILPSEAALGIALTADASVRAAHWLLNNGKLPQSAPLDRRTKDALRARFPHGRIDFTFAGRNRQHTFDFGVEIEDQTVLVEAVTPEPSSINSAIVKALDAAAAPGANVVPLFVYDPADEWRSAALNMLKLGGRGVEFERVQMGDLPLAA